MSIFQQLKVVRRASETQLQVGKNLNSITKRFKGGNYSSNNNSNIR